MNLFKLHNGLIGSDQRHRIVPTLAYDILERGEESYDKNLLRVIARDPRSAHRCAAFILRDRFPLGEPAIAKSAESAYYYARDIIKGRWSDGEVAIARDPHYAYKYARDVIDGRFIEGEPAIMAGRWSGYYNHYYLSVWTPTKQSE